MNVLSRILLPKVPRWIADIEHRALDMHLNSPRSPRGTAPDELERLRSAWQLKGGVVRGVSRLLGAFLQTRLSGETFRLAVSSFLWCACQ